MSTKRPTSICHISSILMSMADLKQRLSLQFRQTLKEYIINLCLLLLFLYDLVIIFLTTPYLFLLAPQCNYQIGRISNTIFLLGFIRRVFLVNHLTIHLIFLLAMHNMSNKPNHNKPMYLSISRGGYLICKITKSK